MGAYTTLRITRGAAQTYLLGKIMDATDEELSDMLDTVLAERLYNATIVPSYDGNDDETL